MRSEFVVVFLWRSCFHVSQERGLDLASERLRFLASLQLEGFGLPVVCQVKTIRSCQTGDVLEEGFLRIRVKRVVARHVPLRRGDILRQAFASSGNLEVGLDLQGNVELCMEEAHNRHELSR